MSYKDLSWPAGVNVIEHANREDQFAARQAKPWRVNASEASALFGENRYLSPFALAQLKLGNELPAADVKMAARGHKWERFIAEQAVEQLNDEARTDDTFYVLHFLPDHCGILNDTYPTLASTPDAMIECRKWIRGGPESEFVWLGPLECKKVHWMKRDEWEGEPPIGYLVQNQVQMMTCGASYGVVAGMISDELIVRVIPRHSGLCDAIVNSTELFLANLEQGLLPPVDGHESTTRALGAFYKAKGESVVELPAEFATLAVELEVAKEEKKAAEARVDAIQNQIKAALGENTIGRVLGGEFSWKPQGGNPTMLKVELSKVEALTLAGIPYEVKASPVTRVLRWKKK